MVVYTEEISFRTTGEGQIVDITDDIETIVGRSGIRTGIVSSSVAGGHRRFDGHRVRTGTDRGLPEDA